MSFDDLSLGLLRKIFGYCSSSSSGKDQESIAQVCHRWADAVQTPALRFSRTCLVVSRCHTSRTTEFIGKGILAKSNRPYTGLAIEWSNTEPNRNVQLLEDLLSICEERFTGVKRMFLRAPPSWTLVRFFVNRREWVKHLVELDVRLEPAASDSTGRELCEVSLPNLRQMTWREYGADGDPSNRWQIGKCCHTFALNVPRLRDLVVIMNCCISRRNMESRQREQETCWLFLPTLELKCYEYLDTVTITGIFRLNQRCLDNSEVFLRKLRVLRFFNTNWRDIEQICEKCVNLKELTVEKLSLVDEIHLQVSPTLSSCLERLSIKSTSQLDVQLIGRQAVFQKLQSFCLRGFTLLLQEVTLVAPQLTECDTLDTNSGSLTIIPHMNQVRTLKVTLYGECTCPVAPLPNVERMSLELTCPNDNFRLVPKYLEHFPNIWHLTVLGCPCLLELAFVERLQRLEYFSAYKVVVGLADVHLLAGLKTLKLTDCILEVKSTDREVSLMAIPEVTIDQVVVDDGPSISSSAAGRFPIRVNANQSPIVFVQVLLGRLNVFSSENVLESAGLEEFKSENVSKLENEMNSKRKIELIEMLRWRDKLQSERDIKPEIVFKSDNWFRLERALNSRQELKSKQVLKSGNMFEEEDQDVEKDIKPGKVVNSENELKPKKTLKSRKKLKSKHVLKLLNGFKEEDVLESEKDIQPEKVLNSENVLKSQKKLKSKVGLKLVNGFKEEDV